MPEGHSVFINARDHQAMLGGKKVRVSSPQGRFAEGAAELDGRTIRRVFAHGKHLFYDFGGAGILHVHLGRLGRFREQHLSRVDEGEPPTAATRVRLAARDVVIDLSGPTACEVLSRPQVEAILARLGPDLLDAAADRGRVWETVRRRATPIGALLMDQSVVAGIGNIFRAEMLYLCRIHPSTPSDALTRAEFNKLWKTGVRLLRTGVDVGRIVSVPLKGLKKPVDKLRRDERFFVYRRKSCAGCGAAVRSIALAGRPCSYCPEEQVLHQP